jgi:hypothetical protein
MLENRPLHPHPGPLDTGSAWRNLTADRYDAVLGTCCWCTSTGRRPSSTARGCTLSSAATSRRWTRSSSSRVYTLRRNTRECEIRSPPILMSIFNDPAPAVRCEPGSRGSPVPRADGACSVPEHRGVQLLLAGCKDRELRTMLLVLCMTTLRSGNPCPRRGCWRGGRDSNPRPPT